MASPMEYIVFLLAAFNFMLYAQLYSVFGATGESYS